MSSKTNYQYGVKPMSTRTARPGKLSKLDIIAKLLSHEKEIERLRNALDVIGYPRRGTEEESMSYEEAAQGARNAADLNRPEEA